jgi:hypothetical protein
MERDSFTRNENFIFWKNMVLVGVFFLITPVTLGISLFSLFSLKTSAIASNVPVKPNDSTSAFSGVQVYASLPDQTPTVSEEVGGSDARPEIVKKYLNSYNSPLVSHSNKLVEVADKYDLDYRLLPAIAQQESNLCKVIPPNSYNCWGWGIHSAGSLGFESFDEGIETVAKGLKTQYLDKGYNSVIEIMSKYNPSSPDGAWGKGVTAFMSDME